MKQEVKQEIVDVSTENRDDDFLRPVPLIELRDSSVSCDGSATVFSGGKRDRVSSGLDGVLSKKNKLDGLGSGSGGPLPPRITSLTAVDHPSPAGDSRSMVDRGCKLFWKAGEYEGASNGGFDSNSGNSCGLIVFLDFVFFCLFV